MTLATAGLLIATLLSPYQQAEAPAEAEGLAISIRAAVTEDGANFTEQQLVDAVTVLVTSKMPDVTIRDDAGLGVLVDTSCLELSNYRGYACSWSAYFARRGRTTGPFGGANELYWSGGGVLTGGTGDDPISHLKDVLDDALDEPIAAWRRLSEAKRQCWIGVFERGVFGAWPYGWKDYVTKEWEESIERSEAALPDASNAYHALNALVLTTAFAMNLARVDGLCGL